MVEPPCGRWVLVRSDRYSIFIDVANHPYLIGRSQKLPPAQQLQSGYASRHHLSVEWRPPSLVITQLGVNPTFCGKDCLCIQNKRLHGDVEATDTDANSDSLTRVTLEFIADETVTEPVRDDKGEGHVVIRVPFSDPSAISSAPEWVDIDTSILYFPRELCLPLFAVRHERDTPPGDGTSASAHLSVSQMLAVPVVDVTEEDGDENTSNGNSVSDNNVVPKWAGLLDLAQQEQAARKRQRDDGRADDTLSA